MRQSPVGKNLELKEICMSHAVSPTFLDNRESDVALRDGNTVHVRPARRSDQKSLEGLLRNLSDQSRYFRFFSGGVNVERAVEQSVGDDPQVLYGLVATTGIDQRVVAHAFYATSGPDRAEIAFAVADEYQGQGIATILLGQLAEVATAAGITSFEATVLPENLRMVEVFRESGFPATVTLEGGDVHVIFPTTVSMRTLDLFDARELTSSAAALQPFLRPRSVAVVGASRAPDSVGGTVLRNLVSAGFAGPVYPVNSRARRVQRMPAHRSIAEIPGPVDLAVIAVPAAAVIDVARECAAKGVRGLLVLSAGFGEAGPVGVSLQRELLELCRGAGMRLIGPNCIGVINTAADTSLNATFASDYPPPGHTAMMSQSGALGLAVITRAADLGLGISQFVSVGNKADISGNDLLGYWADDPETELILMYLESFGNPRKFSRLARRVARQKPIIAVKSGRSIAGARATSSHTGALLAASDVTVDALFKGAGVIRTDTLGEMFDLAQLLAHQPSPTGNRVGVITNAGGPGILCADACDAAGLNVPQLSDELVRRLEVQLPRAAAVGNPVDLLATAPPADYSTAIAAMAESNEVDAIIAIAVPVLGTSEVQLAGAIGNAAAALHGSPPLLAVVMSSKPTPILRSSSSAAGTVPSYQFPEEAARALARAAEYGRWRSAPPGDVPVLEAIDRGRADAIIASGLARSPGWLEAAEVAGLLDAYGIPAVRTVVAVTPEEAGRLADELGSAVALKALAAGLVHKSDARGVRLSLLGARQVSAAAREMMVDVRGAGFECKGFLIQPMVPPAPELILGMVHDPAFGPVIACGAGGTGAELHRDVAVRIAPVTDRDAAAMLRELRTFPLLDGYRGAQTCDVAALEDVILRLSAMVEGHEEIAEVDLNPVLALSRGAPTVDARIRLEEPGVRRPLGARL
jgi:acetyl coenzyme A synthetase (ADP forming)-like protein